MKLSRRCAARLLAAVALMPRQAMFCQATAAPEFEVASIKPSRADSGWQGIDTTPGRIRADSITLERSIREAYDVGPYRVLGASNWMATERWEIIARADRPVDDDNVLMLMLRKLLADRFRLALHRETRMLSSYVLEVGKNGTRMERADHGNPDAQLHGGRGGPTTMDAHNADMDLLTEVLGWRMDRPVVNRTGLKGGFNFTLHWMADTMRTPEDGADDVSIFTAVGEQLGLRLHPTKAPVEVLVIDHAERPSAN